MQIIIITSLSPNQSAMNQAFFMIFENYEIFFTVHWYHLVGTSVAYPAGRNRLAPPLNCDRLIRICFLSSFVSECFKIGLIYRGRASKTLELPVLFKLRMRCMHNNLFHPLYFENPGSAPAHHASPVRFSESYNSRGGARVFA